MAPDYVPLGGATGLADLESRLNPEGSLRAERDRGSGSEEEDDPDRRTAFVGKAYFQDADRDGLFSQAREPQVCFLRPAHTHHWRALKLIHLALED